MSVEAIGVAGMVEEQTYRVSMQRLSHIDYEQARCRDTSEADLAYEADGRGPRSGLSDDEYEALINYCGPCPVQEGCLALSMMTRLSDEGHGSSFKSFQGMVGGLNPKARKHLYEYFDVETKTIPKEIWDTAVNAVLDGRAPQFPGDKAKPTVSDKEAQARILGYLSCLPDKSWHPPEGERFMAVLADAVDIKPGVTSRVVGRLVREGTIERVQEFRTVKALKLVA